MKVQILNGLGAPITMDATRILVTTDSGTPLSLSVEVMPGMVDLGHAEEEDFNVKLRTHGIDRTVQVGALRMPRIEDFEFRL